MKDKRRLLLLVVLLIAALLAFLLRDVFSVYILPPIAKFLFVFRGYYRAVAQVDYWLIVLVFVAVIGFLSLRLFRNDPNSTQPAKTDLWGESSHGDVHQLAYWLENLPRQSPFARNRRQDSYCHWYVARTLANLAVDILHSRGVSEDRESRLEGPGWSPPAQIQNYLEIGLRSNPIKFRQMLNSAQLTIPDAEEVIRYLESYVESTQ